MIKSRIAMAGALLAVTGSAFADFTVTPTLTSDYDWRGISQTQKDPAFQLGLNYAHDSGFYVGAWGSNVDFGPGKPDVELDVFAGFSGGDAEESFGYDVGLNYYSYPSTGSLNFLEIYAGVSKGWFAGKVWFSPEFGGKHTGESAVYLEGNVTVPLPQDFSILGHVGHSFGNFWDTYASNYTDYSVGLGKSFGNVSLSVKYVDGSDHLDGRVMGAITTTLPWASE